MSLPSKRKADGEQKLDSTQQEDWTVAVKNTNNCNKLEDSQPMAVFHHWTLEEGHVGVVLHTLSFFGVTELVHMKQVCKKWQQLCTQAIDSKCPNPKIFETNQELKDTVRKYCKNQPANIEEIAVVYGYPINKWKVQELVDFSHVFSHQSKFNEDISSWDLSNAKTMESMFYQAT